MDWARAKTILIAAFIITNIFLAYNVWQAKYYGYTSERISEQSISEMVAILEGKDIKVKAPIPKDIYVDGILTVEYMEIDAQQLFETVFDHNYTNPTIHGDTIKHVKGGTILQIKNNREIFYNNLDLRSMPRASLTEQEALMIGENFLKKLGLYRDAMVTESIRPTDNGYHLSFGQLYKNRPLEISTVEMEVTAEGVYSMRMLWLNPVETQPGRKKIIHALDALIKLAGRREVLDNTPVEIDSIDLVHYFDWETAREGEALPAWRICVNNHPYYVNALTGQIDR